MVARQGSKGDAESGPDARSASWLDELEEFEAGEKMTWAVADPEDIVAVVLHITALGGAVQFGTTLKGNALSLIVYAGDKIAKLYPDSDVALKGALGQLQRLNAGQNRA